MEQIFSFFKAVGGLIVNFVEGIRQLFNTTGDGYSIIVSWSSFLPTTVWYYIQAGLVLTIILVILGRANK